MHCIHVFSTWYMVKADGKDDSKSTTSAATSKGQNKLASVLSGVAC